MKSHLETTRNEDFLSKNGELKQVHFNYEQYIFNYIELNYNN